MALQVSKKPDENFYDLRVNNLSRQMNKKPLGAFSAGAGRGLQVRNVQRQPAPKPSAVVNFGAPKPKTIGLQRGPGAIARAGTTRVRAAKPRGALEQPFKQFLGSVVGGLARAPADVGSALGTFTRDPLGSLSEIGRYHPLGLSQTLLERGAERVFGRDLLSPQDYQTRVATSASNRFVPESVRRAGANIEDFSARKARDVDAAVNIMGLGGTRPGENRFVGGLAEGAGSLGTSIALARAGVPGAAAALFGTRAMGEQIRGAREAGLDPAQAFGRGTLAFGLEAGLERVGLDRFMNAGGPPLVNMLNRALTEGVQEASQSLAQAGVTATYEDVDWSDALTQALIEAGYGALLGSGASIGMDGLNKALKDPQVITNYKNNIADQLNPATRNLRETRLGNKPDQAPVESKPEVTLKQKPNEVEAFAEEQEQLRTSRTESKGRSLVQLIKRNIVDPRTVEQSLDNAEFKRLKKAGLVREGQKELDPEQSIASQTGLIENPGEAGIVLDKTKYGNEGSEYSIEDIIKHYGNDNSKAAREFENYRIFKDELWRQEQGAGNTLGIRPESMAEEVARYEQTNPLAVEHHAALRMASLAALRMKRDARIDDPELFEKSAVNPYYTPREGQTPEDLLSPHLTGGIRSGAQTTKGRAKTSGGPVRSPLSIYQKVNRETIRSIAEQRKGLILRERTQRGDFEFKGQPFKEVLDAEVVKKHKKTVQELREISELRKKLKQERNKINTNKRLAKKDLKTSSKELDNKIRGILRKSVADPDAKAAINSLTTEELSEVAAAMIEENDAPVWRVTKSFSKKSEAHAKLALELEEARAVLEAARALAQDTAQEASETYQNVDRGTQTYSYRLDGETGRIEIPISYAKELDAANKARNKGLIERGLIPLANAQKIFWTGTFAPAFKAYNILIKNPILSYRNADGFSGISPSVLGAVARQVVNTKKMQEFKNDMRKRGISYQNAFETKKIQQSTSEGVAARADFESFVKRNPIKTLKDVWKAFDHALAFPDNVQRTAVAYGAYKRAKRLGWSEEAALQAGAAAPGKIFGDFNRVSRLAQDAEILVPYSGALQSGARALGRATKTKPIQTTVKDATLISTIAGLTLYGLSHLNDDEEENYYTDMIESGKEWVLDSNFTIVMPWASKDENGDWSGVYHVPITPDLRPMVKATWRTVYGLVNGEGADASLLASEGFDLFTGDVKDSIYDSGATNEGENPLNAVFSGSPVVATGKTLAGINPRTGEPLADDAMSRKPRVEQHNDFTSGIAKNISRTVGGVLTPLQIDSIFDRLGHAGDVIQNRDEDQGRGGAFVEGFTKPFQSKQGLTDKKRSGRAHFKDVDEVGATLENDDDFRVFQALNSSNSVKTPFDSAARAKELLARPDVLKAFGTMDNRARSRGVTGDPFFDLTHEQQQRVLLYKASKDLNNAKQAYDKNGNPLFTSLGLDEPWYSEFKDKESARWDEIFKNNPDAEATNLTFSGATKPRSEKMTKLQNEYFDLPKGSARKAFLQQHPELLDHWAQVNQFTNAERVALGLEISEDDEGYGKYGKKQVTIRPSQFAVSSKPPSLGGSRIKKISLPKQRAKYAAIQKPKVTLKKGTV